jgi:hypothetical protein
MAFSELYQALQSGVVDGTEGTPSNFWTQKIYEVQKHITLSNHGHLAYAAIVNKKFWDGLPADIRTTLDGCMKDATTYANAIAATENVQALEKIRASGKTTVYQLTPAEALEWKKALMVVHKEMEGRVGKDAVTAAYKEAGFVPVRARPDAPRGKPGPPRLTARAAASSTSPRTPVVAVRPRRVVLPAPFALRREKGFRCSVASSTTSKSGSSRSSWARRRC